MVGFGGQNKNRRRLAAITGGLSEGRGSSAALPVQETDGGNTNTKNTNIK